jgi:hypothetical protein
MIACQHCFSKNAADVVCVMREGSFAASSHPSPRVSKVPNPEVSIARPSSPALSEGNYLRRAPAKANVYVISLWAVLCLCNGCTFQNLRLFARESWAT